MPLKDFLEVQFKQMLSEASKDTRHAMRQEFAAVAAKVEASNITNASSHATTSVKLDNLSAKVDELGKMEPRLAHVEAQQESESAVAAAVDKMRDWNLRLMLAVLSAAGAFVALH